jgi:hypothetical protein
MCELRESIEPGTIRVDVLLHPRDFLRANYWYLFKKFRFPFVLFFLGGVVYPILYFAGTFEEPTGTENYWGFLVIPGIVFFLLIATYLGSKRHFKSNKALQEQIHYSFSGNGINASAESSSGHTSWSNIREAFETRNNFLLFISNNQMYTIPKRFFKDEEHLGSFKQLLRSQLQSRAKLK